MVRRGTVHSDSTILVPHSRPFWLVDQHLWRLLLAVTVADLAVIALVPVIFLIDPDGSNQGRLVIATMIAVILLPAQEVLLWKMLREITLEHRRTRALRSRIRQVLAEKDLTIAFQPIVATASGRIVEAEALSRFRGAPAEPPDTWFAGAAEVGLGTELELMAVDMGLPDPGQWTRRGQSSASAHRLDGDVRAGMRISRPGRGSRNTRRARLPGRPRSRSGTGLPDRAADRGVDGVADLGDSCPGHQRCCTAEALARSPRC